jgi:predicted DNA-binding transcriptional regulator YafY
MAFRVYDEYDAFERLADGSFLIRARMPKGEGMMQYILSFGECCEVLEPADVRDAVVARLKKILARYEI